MGVDKVERIKALVKSDDPKLDEPAAFARRVMQEIADLPEEEQAKVLLKVLDELEKEDETDE